MNCLICDSGRVESICERRQFERFSLYAPFVENLGRYNRSIFRCEDCGFAFIGPLYTAVEIDELYGKYKTFADRCKSNLFSAQEVTIWLEQLSNIGLQQWVTDFEKKHSRRPRMLDVGSGYGRILHLFDLMGCEVHGIDLNRDGIEYIQKEYGFDVEFCDLFAYDPTVKYDLVTLFHVIEHVCDPRRAFAKIESLLSEDGLFLLETPWADDVGLYDERYCDIYHTLFFNHLSLFLLGARHDLSVRSTQNISFVNEDYLVDEAKKPPAFHKYLQVLFERRAVRNEFNSNCVKALGATFNRLEAECSSSISRAWNLEHQNDVYKRLLEDPAMRKRLLSDILCKDFKCTKREMEKFVAIVYEIGANFLSAQ